MGNPIIELRKELSATLNPMRYEHSLSVSFTCASLAMRYEYDLEKAELAGLVHDCAKRYDDETILKKCRKQGIGLTEDELRAPSVIHAKYGAFMASEKYSLTDPEITSAIRWHTTGRPQMELWEKLLFVADYIEPRRCKAENLPEIRKLAFTDLDACIFRILEDTVAYLRKKGGFIDSMTLKAFEYYRARPLHSAGSGRPSDFIRKE